MRQALTALILAASAVAFTAVYSPLATPVSATSCKDVTFIFARGSGQELNSAEYKSFRSGITTAMSANPNISYDFYELGVGSQNNHRYPAVALNFFNTISAAVSAGSAFSYGESVKEGIDELTNYISSVNSICKDTKFVLSGYSQGAQVVSLAADRIDASKIIYLATFGDPKLYLPEGNGISPDACRGINLSPYREYAPNCHTYKGSLGAKNPYESSGYNSKVGLWCNDKDLICGAGLNLTGGSGDDLLEKLKSAAISAHTSYATKKVIASATKTIGDKVKSFYKTKPNKNTLPVPDAINDSSAEDQVEQWSIPTFDIVLVSCKSLKQNPDFFEFLNSTILNILSSPSLVKVARYDDCTNPDEYNINQQPKIIRDASSIPLSCRNAVYNIDNRNLQNQYSIPKYSALTSSQIPSSDLPPDCNLYDYVKYSLKLFQLNNVRTRTIYVVSDDIEYQNYLTAQTWQQLNTLADTKQTKINFVSPANPLDPVLGLGNPLILFGQPSIPDLAIDTPQLNNVIASSGLPEIKNLSYRLTNDGILSLEYQFVNDAALAYLSIDDAPLGLTALEKLEISDVTPGAKIILTPIGKDGSLGQQIEYVIYPVLVPDCGQSS